MKKENKNTILKHIFAWIFVCIYLGISDPGEDSFEIQIIINIVFCLNDVWIFYAIANYFMPKILENESLKGLKYFLLPLSIVFVGICFVMYDYIVFYYFIPSLGGTDYVTGMPLITMIRHSTTAYAMFTIPAIFYYFNNKHSRELEKKNQIEKQLIVSELNFLKNQFHDHIIFNFLNHVYSKTYKHSIEAAEAIEIFSDMLRYSMRIKPDEKSSLIQEIEYISNFIQIQKILTKSVNVNFNYKGEMENKFILPRILITFVENAFKHGDFNDLNNPIEIDLRCQENNILFNVKNKKSKNKNVISHKIGLENFRQILDLFYSDRYHLQVLDEQDEYHCHLNLLLI